MQGTKPTRFQERFAVSETGTGGILLDLATGSFYKLNPAGVRVFLSLAAGEEVADAIKELQAAFAISQEAAAQDIAALLSQLEDKESPRKAPSREFTFTAVAGEYILHYHGYPLLRTDAMGRRVELAAGDEPREVGQALHWILPHLLLLQGHGVLHAAAVERHGRVIAFCGATGTGKSTVATTFAACGAALIADDILVLALGEDGPRAFVDAEAALRRWVARSVPKLANKGHVDASELGGLVRGPQLAPAEVWFLEASRAGTQLVTSYLAPVDALTLFLTNSFAELGDRDVWRRILASSTAIARLVACRRAKLPASLEALRSACERYPARQAGLTAES